MSKRKQQGCSGIDPLSYMGIEAQSPVLLLSYNRAPTPVDKKGFHIGTVWLDYSDSPIGVWMLVAKDPYLATWVQFAVGMAQDSTYTADIGVAVPLFNELILFGSSVVETAAAGSTIVVGFTNASDGEVIVGGGTDPDWASITSTGGTITITTGPNSINLEAAGTAALLDITADTGSASQVAGNIDILGGTNINTAAATNVLDVNLDNNVDISGSLTVSSLSAGVVQTNIVGTMFSDGGDDGEVLIGATGAAPAWANITSTDGSITVTNGPNSINLESNILPVGTRESFLGEIRTSPNKVVGSSTSTGVYIGSAALGVVVEIFDNGGNFYPGTSPHAIYTAPRAGKYFLAVHHKVFVWALSATPLSGTPDTGIFTLRMETSNRDYVYDRTVPLYYKETFSPIITVCADMDIGDTVEYFVNLQIFGKPLSAYDDIRIFRGYVSGYLIEEA